MSPIDSFDHDSALNKLRFVGWLERNGRLVTGPETCSIKWLTRSGIAIADFTIPSTMSTMPGIFQSEQSIADIVPDEAGPLKITISYNEVNYTSACGVASWD